MAENSFRISDVISQKNCSALQPVTAGRTARQSRSIQQRNGRVTEFAMNDKCLPTICGSNAKCQAADTLGQTLGNCDRA